MGEKSTLFSIKLSFAYEEMGLEMSMRQGQDRNANPTAVKKKALHSNWKPDLANLTHKGDLRVGTKYVKVCRIQPCDLNLI